MSPLPDLAQQALDHARRGDFQQALLLARRALARNDGDLGLMLFVDLLHTRRTELKAALPHFRAPLNLAPRAPVPRVEHAGVVSELNQLDEAEELLRSSVLPGLEPKGLSALIANRRGDPRRAQELYQQIVPEDP